LLLCGNLEAVVKRGKKRGEYPDLVRTSKIVHGSAVRDTNKGLR